MKVYHASKFIIESPDIYHSRDLLDFGKGFYLTSLVEQAKKYAQRFLFQGDKAYLNQYILDENLDREYKIKEFIGYNEEWLDFVALCRIGKQASKFDTINDIQVADLPLEQYYGTEGNILNLYNDDFKYKVTYIYFLRFTKRDV